MTAQSTRPTMYFINDGRQTIGFIYPRGRTGFEAYAATADGEQSSGIFESAPAAATACWRHMHGQPIGGTKS